LGSLHTINSSIKMSVVDFIRQAPLITSKIYQHYRYIRPYARASRKKNALSSGTNISVFSSPRGGSTWVGELMCAMPDSFFVFEPLFLTPPYPEMKDVGFRWNPHIPEDTEWPEAEEYFRKLFNREVGSLRSLRIYFHNHIPDITQAKYFIYKECNSNMLLPWLVKRFDINPIYVVRHPCAVVASQLRYKFWDRLIDNPRAPLVDETSRFKHEDSRYTDLLKVIKYPEERIALEWAFNNSLILDHPDNNVKWITVAYERMYNKPEVEINRIFGRLGLPVPAEIMKKVKNVSNSALQSSVQRIADGSQIGAWRDELGPKRVANILNILKEVGCDYYGDGLEPDYSKVYKNELD
jgi:hypothetical protein